MDIYAYPWFQFLFPLYVWFLIGCIILAGHYSQSIAKRLRQNPVAVLATLLLMSYSKVLQAIIAPLSFTYLTYYNSSDDSESHPIIWLYDGSIGFFLNPSTLLLDYLLSYLLLCLSYRSFFFFSLVIGFKVTLTGGFFHS